MRIEGTPDSLPPQKLPVSVVRVGNTYRFLVESVKDGEGVLRLSNGAIIRARIESSFVPGRWYKAVAVREGQKVVLQQLARPDQSPRSALRSLGLPQDQIAEQVVRAFVGQHVSLDRRALQTAYRRLSHSSREQRQEKARLSAILHDKGLLDSEEVWNRLEAMVAGPGNYSRQDDSDRKRRRSNEELPRPTYERQKLVDAISASFATTDNASDLLHIFNHVTGSDDHWVVIPLRVSENTSQYATLRLRIPKRALRGAPKREIPLDLAILDVREDNNEWTFSLRPNQSGSKELQVSLLRQTGPAPSKAQKAAFEHALQEIGARFVGSTDDVPPVYDFSLDKSGDIIPNADVEA
ncbi:MAG: hypothetical protein ACLFP4_06370 [Spirochaetales bacterium]